MHTNHHCSFDSIQLAPRSKYSPTRERWIDRLVESVLAHGQCLDCLEWSGPGNRYGAVRYQGRNSGVHRVSYELFRGPISDGMFICHSCDNTKCYNPLHLFEGTPSDNTRDALAKGRINPTANLPTSTKGIVRGPRLDMRGERNTSAKLIECDVRFIRAEYERGVGPTELGKRFGVNRTTIQSIVRRKQWKHI